MAYHGYIPFIKTVLTKIKYPKILEIGTDKGMTSIPLIVHMCKVHSSFEFVGVDIHIQDSLEIILKNIDIKKEQKIKLHQENSLQIMPKLADSGEKFDVILLDGDHNFFTVQKELEYLEKISKSTSLVIIDDYHGRWSEKDLWYAEKENYKSIDLATQKVETEKHGVKPAVDDFLVANQNWESKILMNGEPIVLYKKKNMFEQNVFDIL